jgi:3-deoxy-manno-octulosonate cytidylyltransferase (CMP-KDO synthetase)
LKILGIIPARYASTRFPAKALADIAGKSMVQRVYEQARKAGSLQAVIVATDHADIYRHVQSFGGKVVMTSPDHPSGTDRCFEASQKTDLDYDFVINIQGDEPFIQPEQIDTLASVLTSPEVQLATLVRKIEASEALFDPNKVRVILNVFHEAIYFSRNPIPYVRGAEEEEWLQKHTFYQHIGMYAYRTDILAEVTRLPVSSLERAESLEQLRWIENGYHIKTAVTPHESMGIDTPDDLRKVLATLGNEK